jgi:hypothetical protein
MMSKDMKDVIEGAPYLIVFLIFCYILGRAVQKYEQMRYRWAFAPLAPLINGVFQKDGRETGIMVGMYQGRDVILRMSANAGTHGSVAGDIRQKFNFLEITMSAGEGKQDWDVSFGGPWGFSRLQWQIDSPDARLQGRLTQANVLQTVLNMQDRLTVKYSADKKTLEYKEDIRPHLAPSLQRFQQQLDLLVYLSEVNSNVNPV